MPPDFPSIAGVGGGGSPKLVNFALLCHLVIALISRGALRCAGRSTVGRKGRPSV